MHSQRIIAIYAQNTNAAFHGVYTIHVFRCGGKRLHHVVTNLIVVGVLVVLEAN